MAFLHYKKAPRHPILPDCSPVRPAGVDGSPFLQWSHQKDGPVAAILQKREKDDKRTSSKSSTNSHPSRGTKDNHQFPSQERDGTTACHQGTPEKGKQIPIVSLPLRFAKSFDTRKILRISSASGSGCQNLLAIALPERRPQGCGLR